MIEINNLVKIYNQTITVDIAFLEIKNIEIVGLVGNNGAGKTTFFRLLLDLARANKGTITLKGKNVAVTEDWKSYTSAYLDDGFLIEYLTPMEYFYFCGRLHNFSEEEVDLLLIPYESFFEDGTLRGDKFIRDLSKENQFKVGLVACFLQQPELLILDEPFANLDPSSQIRLIKILKELNERNITIIIISSHDLNHVTDLCTRILLMEGGKILQDVQTNSSTLIELEEYFEI